MKLLESQIEDIIYESPWLLDERFDIPDIGGSGNYGKGRQINIGRNGTSRYIDLLFRDSRDQRPVIIELKKGELARVDIAQILEYRALVVSMDEDRKAEWEAEFGRNYYCPKLMLIGEDASEEVRISANIAGVEIRVLKGHQKLEVDFGEIEDITAKISEWNEFRKSGNRTIDDREEWIRKIYSWFKEVVEDHDEDIRIKNLFQTTAKYFWTEKRVFPFINFAIDHDREYICGFYEYFDENLKFSNEFIYSDIMVNTNDYEIDEELELKIERIATRMIKEKGFDFITFDDSIATIRFERSLLEGEDAFGVEVKRIIDVAIEINRKVYEMLEGDF